MDSAAPPPPPPTGFRIPRLLYLASLAVSQLTGRKRRPAFPEPATIQGGRYFVYRPGWTVFHLPSIPSIREPFIPYPTVEIQLAVPDTNEPSNRGSRFLGCRLDNEASASASASASLPGDGSGAPWPPAWRPRRRQYHRRGQPGSRVAAGTHPRRSALHTRSGGEMVPAIRTLKEVRSCKLSARTGEVYGAPGHGYGCCARWSSN